MDNIIEINGKEYTEDELREEVEHFVVVVKKAWDTIVTFFENAIETIWEMAMEYVEYLVNHTPVGYKRYFKMDKLKYYESISIGKSNNWRKAHGLSLKRKLIDN
ncbi:hypothetical protein [Paraliobacillus sp. X-1268]|uniref:hypothetical protein n=1 Tax=Paraliobacillus sp. X-1268 TaxID=2213193 RepID=UPI000E3BF127|nr:hypothetical protein [Paraliobacillus sp. X-1268]